MRFRVQAPLDVTVLRSGIPDTVPGRSVNLGEDGIGAFLAGELTPGEAVAVEVRLSPGANPVRARALVRHHNKLRYGMQFVGLSVDQQAAIRNWLGETKAEAETGQRPPMVVETRKDQERRGPGRRAARFPRRKKWWPALLFLLAAAAILAALFWWRWNRAWADLEFGLQKNQTATTLPQVQVPADAMAKLVTHRVDPDYPAAARREKLSGVVVVDVVVGRDGSVLNTRAVSGPQVLTEAAMAALRWWRFEPYRVDGQPMVVETTVAVEFKP
jgi:TonB family protein